MISTDIGKFPVGVLCFTQRCEVRGKCDGGVIFMHPCKLVCLGVASKAVGRRCHIKWPGCSAALTLIRYRPDEQVELVCIIALI